MGATTHPRKGDSIMENTANNYTGDGAGDRLRKILGYYEETRNALQAAKDSAILDTPASTPDERAARRALIDKLNEAGNILEEMRAPYADALNALYAARYMEN
jgi:hypothetical protein